MLFAYIGPETMMPVASIIAAVAGVFMMFGRNVVGFGRGLVRRVWPGPPKAQPARVSSRASVGASPTANVPETTAEDPEATGV